MRKIKKKHILIAISALLCFVFLAAVSVPIVANIFVLSTNGNIKDDFEGRYDCILVLGAGVRRDGTPSDMLADRLKVAIELYNKGLSDKILLSGDTSVERDYDEVTVMESYCIKNGIPSEAIVKDGQGYSTYESVLNLKNSGKYTSVIIVTQKYHLYRALYIAKQLGIEAMGADAELRKYSGQTFRDVREIAARTKDFLIVSFDK